MFVLETKRTEELRKLTHAITNYSAIRTCLYSLERKLKS